MKKNNSHNIRKNKLKCRKQKHSRRINTYFIPVIKYSNNGD